MGEQNRFQKKKLNSDDRKGNDIAHGRTISASIGTIEKYFASGLRILSILDSLLAESD